MGRLSTHGRHVASSRRASTRNKRTGERLARLHRTRSGGIVERASRRAPPICEPQTTRGALGCKRPVNYGRMKTIRAASRRTAHLLGHVLHLRQPVLDGKHGLAIVHVQLRLTVRRSTLFTGHSRHSLKVGSGQSRRRRPTPRMQRRRPRLRGPAPRSSLPDDPRVALPQPRAALGVQRRHPGDPAEQVGAEVGHAVAVLRLRIAARGVVEDRLERVVLVAGDVRARR